MSKRLGFRKSRNGCSRCKKRRVKCDEAVPCTACIRHDKACSLENPQPSVCPNPAAAGSRHRSTEASPPMTSHLGISSDEDTERYTFTHRQPHTNSADVRDGSNSTPGFF
ncbi:hypothetical protein Forpe1208_v011783 [Fusarium oxysporum f. sp. rapae]|uniref:Zn(2)-C6 fungal-type domain-containing protein n=1 Tax=Fusarium oxysporum f. sp. rapae TaxID=485398 RepID=A0A8J5TQA4_FUSOX|nr:hypothetical protein Forpe1208_v011783 [Fusarium oxysporum f. sp. rapae]